MWFLLALAVLAPVVWALAGAPRAAEVAAWADQLAPGLPSATVPQPAALLATVLLGVLLSVARTRTITGHLSTVVHEFGHGLVAALLGGRIDRIRLHPDGSGVTYHLLPTRRPVRSFLVSAAGYPAPGVLAVATIQVTQVGLASVWLAYLVAVLAVMLLLTLRSWWAVLVALVLGAAGWLVLALGIGPVPSLVTSLLAGLLSGGGAVDAVGQWRGRRESRRSDAQAMAEQTRLPVGLFAGAHVLLAWALAGAVLAVPVTDVLS